MAKLSGGVAVINVAATEIEMKEKRKSHRAGAATKAALGRGYCAGGGVTLLGPERFLQRAQSPKSETKLSGEYPFRKALTAAIKESSKTPAKIRRGFAKVESSKERMISG